MRKSMISLLLVLSMLASMMLSTHVGADVVNNGQGSDVTTNGEYQDSNWKAGGDGVKTYNVQDSSVTLSKKAKPVEGQENTFEVTLKVETSTNTVVTTNSGAVVLVVDTSSSMNYCAECGNNGYHNSKCSYYKRFNNGVSDSQSRMSAAINAALEFLSAYAGEDASADRRLAIVTFATNYSTKLDWVNVAGGSGKNDYDKAVSAINGLSANGGTNLEGGLYTALNEIKSSRARNAASKNVVLLTDGAPTFSMNGGDGSNGSAANNSAAANQATAIKNQGATLYTVCFGVANETTYWNGPTVGNFLSNSVASSGCAYNANNTDELYAAFEAITESVVTGLDGAGWIVEDPMGDMFSITGNLPANFAPVSGTTYEWKLSEPQVTSNGGVTYYVYTCTYQVVLNVLDPDFVEGTYYPTNGPTSLMIDDQDYGYLFPVPGAKGVLPRTDITVEKVWNDLNNQDGLRPGSVTIQLLKNGQPADSLVLDARQNWKGTFKNMEVYQNGTEITYSVRELNIAPNYESVVTGSAENGFVVTNTQKLTIAGSKTWNDANDQDRIRPESITIYLLKDGMEIDSKSVTAADGWKWEFKNLDKYENGKKIIYTILEDEVEGYTTAVNGYNVTNTHVPAAIDIYGTKTWVDNDNQDGMRPEKIMINLLADGKEVQEIEVTAANDWVYEFTNLPKYENGREIVYTITEDAVENYTTEIDGYNVLNTHAPEQTAVKVTKIWDDGNNQDGNRPESVQIHLYANDTHIDTVEVTEADGWTYTWTDLEKYRDGKEIRYTVFETPGTEYTVAITGNAKDGFVVTNSYKPQTITINGVKIWEDADNQDGVRPESITVTLLADGVAKETLTVTGENGWRYSWTNLPKFSAGTEIQYTISEAAVEKYTTQIEGFNLINTHEVEKTSYTVNKIWQDNNDQDGLRPESIYVQLFANGEKTGDAIALTAENQWTYTWTELDKYTEGEVAKEVVYTVDEIEVPQGYYKKIEGNTITNTCISEVVEFSVTKIWKDGNDQDQLRPESVQVQLYADGTPYGEVVTLNNENHWTYTWTQLPKNAAGQKITYTVQEVNVPEGYRSVVEGGMITNIHEVEKVVLVASKNQSVNGGTITGETLNVKAGETVTYYLSVRNDSKVAVRDIVIEDAIPAGLTYVDGSADKGGVAAEGMITWNIGELAAGEAVTVSFRVIVPETEKDAKWNNEAIVTYQDGTPDEPGEEFDPEGRKTIETNGVAIVQIHSVATGDRSDMGLWVVVAAMGVLLLGALVTVKKKNDFM